MLKKYKVYYISKYRIFLIYKKDIKLNDNKTTEIFNHIFVNYC